MSVTAILMVLASQTAGAATPVFKCTIDGRVSYQNDPCPTGEVRPRPTVQQLNAERQLKLRQAAERPQAPKTSTSAAAPDLSAPAAAHPPAAALASDGERRPFTMEAGPSFRCDGRKYCSQMTSCAEAKFFLARCPGVKMDGDGDGIPCERQWCGK